MNEKLFEDMFSAEKSLTFDEQLSKYYKDEFLRDSEIILNLAKEKKTISLDQTFNEMIEKTHLTFDSVFMFLDIIMKHAARKKKILVVDLGCELEEKAIFENDGENYEITVTYQNGTLYSFSSVEENGTFTLKDVEFQR